MLVGPFDRRKRRHRCGPCSRSHLKAGALCSGDSPCTACVKRNHACHYSTTSHTRPVILIGRGKHETIDTFVGQIQDELESSVANPQITKSPNASPMLFYFSYYDIFLQKNKFTGLGTPWKDVKELMKRGDPETYLLDAMLSLGGMQALKLCEVSKSKKIHEFALESYTRAIAGLRHALSGTVDDAQSRARILWTTLLLGLFELMNDSTGDGWLQHLVHGTAQALIAGGPSTCISGSCRIFFTESKVFEVCRSVVFNQPSFLAEEKWMALSASLRPSLTSRSQRALDLLLDIVVRCSSLRVQAANLIESIRSSGLAGIAEHAQGVSLQGFALRDQLRGWALIYHTSNVFRDLGTPQDSSLADDRLSEPEPEPEPQLLAETFFSATSIYLSGVFDYEIGYWQSLHLPAPTLSEDEIQQHVTSILALSQRLIVETSISPLLLLYPLRVASARARQTSQKQQIMKLLGIARSSFAVAGAFMADIEDLWGTTV
ncbi:hypothetical protein C8A00DRAFT_11007 [Chaetomidium leptoderma]|uniref:Zn(2)-C6 fungal-type domain-containing protein n=1 Tax=Chaetomidium leptoderma TaxID=669021 RepID=A0AAN6VVR5_9PEZI|nr:hypothetical protein C8A00DRAFT_11007 [Chaetomidium leptoderma]